MVVAPALVDVAGPRIHIQPVDGLPLLHIAQPELTGPRKALEGGFDRLLALVLTLLLLPVLVAVAVVVKLSGPGPVCSSSAGSGWMASRSPATSSAPWWWTPKRASMR